MKKYLLIMLAVLFFTLFSSCSRYHIVNIWKIEDAVSPDNSDNYIAKMLNEMKEHAEVTFNRDGFFSLKMNDFYSKGIWLLDKKASIVYTTNAEGDTTVNHILKSEKTKLQLNSIDLRNNNRMIITLVPKN